MMKKVITILLIVTFSTILISCGGSSELEQLRKENEELKAMLETPTPTPANSAIPQKLDASTTADVQVFKWTEVFLNATEYHNDLLVTNKYDTPLKFTIETLFYDANGNVLGKDTSYTHAIMKGQSDFVSIDLQDAEFANAEYTITPSKSSLSAIDTTKLTYSLSSGGNDTKYVLSMTNNDSVDYSNTGAYVVFYNGEDIVKVELVYTHNADYKLLAGSTEYKDFSYSGLYTNYTIYPFGTIQ